MSPNPTVARLVIVEGLVQGVGYREFTRRAALRIGASGWVRNRSDGAVEALIVGSPEAVEAMLAEMRRGPSGARVIDLQATPADMTASGFLVLPTIYRLSEILQHFLLLCRT